ncbi:MAG: beta-ketoacyl-ACP synthase III [Candidatus Symbiobacter sp.]|nr:beta-ketoacyl-ACP synthase III [Candidatus Symbiobacter sp.]
MTLYRSILLGSGGYLPSRIVTNDELATRLDTSHDWIFQRTGIAARHLVAPDETTTDMATAAAKAALAHAKIEGGDIDAIVLATTTPTDIFPATATQVQHRIGAGGFALDVQAVCSGFIYALAVADNFIRLGQAKNALVIGAESFSRLLDWQDRGTCVLFGDGAGAVVLSRHEPLPNEGASPRGVLSTHLHSDGAYRDMLYVAGGPGSVNAGENAGENGGATEGVTGGDAGGDGKLGHVRMEGKEVFRHATEKMAAVVMEALAANQLSAAQVDWLIPHQANRRIIDATARKLGFPAEKVIVTVEHHANSSAASIPLALAAGFADGRVRPGQLLLLEALGGGLTWGAALIRV